MKKKITDERVEKQSRKIESEAFGILMTILLGSVFIKSLILGLKFQEYAVEFFAVTVVMLYVMVRLWVKGIDFYNTRANYQQIKRQNILGSIIAGIIVMALTGIPNYLKYKDIYDRDGIGPFGAVLLVTFISATLLTFVILELLSKTNQTRQKQIQRKLDDQEKQ